jgi:hypothetical protein
MDFKLERVDPDGTGNTRLTLSASPEDAERFLQAFKDGKLADMGIFDVQIPNSEQVRPEDKMKVDEALSQGEAAKPSKVPPRT